jgi:hypothetical protein
MPDFTFQTLVSLHPAVAPNAPSPDSATAEISDCCGMIHSVFGIWAVAASGSRINRKIRQCRFDIGGAPFMV